jgi:hypothetical protein
VRLDEIQHRPRMGRQAMAEEVNRKMSSGAITLSDRTDVNRPAALSCATRIMGSIAMPKRLGVARRTASLLPDRNGPLHRPITPVDGPPTRHVAIGMGDALMPGHISRQAPSRTCQPGRREISR